MQSNGDGVTRRMKERWREKSCERRKGMMTLAVAIGLVVSATYVHAKAAAERQEICREAGGRYHEIYGKAPKDESFVAILMFKDNFCPINLTVKEGDKLRWVNVDKRTSHSVWFKEAGRPESDRVFPEEFVEMTVDLPPGAYTYLCGPHWEKEGMVGRLTVTRR